MYSRNSCIITFTQKEFFCYFSAEFIIDLAKKNNSFDGFKRELLANDADFSVSGCAAVIGLLSSCQ